MPAMPVAAITGFLVLYGLILWALCALTHSLWPLVLLILLPFAWRLVDRLVPLGPDADDLVS